MTYPLQRFPVKNSSRRFSEKNGDSKFGFLLNLSTLVHGNKAKLKCLSLALLRCKSKFEIFESGLIAVQNEIRNF